MGSLQNDENTFITGNKTTNLSTTIDNNETLLHDTSSSCIQFQIPVISHTISNTMISTSHNDVFSDSQNNFDSTSFLPNSNDFHNFENHESSSLSRNFNEHVHSSNEFPVPNSDMDMMSGSGKFLETYRSSATSEGNLINGNEDEIHNLFNGHRQTAESSEEVNKSYHEVALLLERLKADQLANALPATSELIISFPTEEGTLPNASTSALNIHENQFVDGVRRSLRERRKNTIELCRPSAESSHKKTNNKAKSRKLKNKEKNEDQTQVQPNNKIIEEYCSNSNSSFNQTKKRKCIVCLRQQMSTEDIFDDDKNIHYYIDVLTSHLNLDLKVNEESGSNNENSGLCTECKDNLQRWHLFKSAIKQKHESSEMIASKTKICNSTDNPITEGVEVPKSIDLPVSRTYKEMGKVKEVFEKATHPHYIHRHLNEKDMEYFCDKLVHSHSVKSANSKELEIFLMSEEKLSHILCVKCDKLIAGKTAYDQHKELEHSESPIIYPCDLCGNVFPEKDMTASTEDYYPHWISHFYFHSCAECCKRFPTKRSLGQHRHSVHLNRQVKCDKCDKVLSNKVSLDLHKLKHLPEHDRKQYSIKCKICKKSIAQWNFKTHLATHDEDKPWKCDMCSSAFKTKGTLVCHRDVVHFNLKNHVCSLCGEAFKSASSLGGHVRRHQGRKDHKCDVCQKEFYTYSALKGHKIAHQTTFDFVCEACGKRFKKKKALQEHYTIHTGEKLHRCPICGREVRVKSNLYKHMKIHKKETEKSATGRNVTEPLKERSYSTILQANMSVDASTTTTTFI